MAEKMEIDDQSKQNSVNNELPDLAERNRKRELTKEEKSRFQKLLRWKRALEKKNKSAEPKSTPSKKEIKFQKDKKEAYKSICEVYLSLKDKKREIKNELSETISQIEKIKGDFPIFIGNLEQMIDYHSKREGPADEEVNEFEQLAKKRKGEDKNLEEQERKRFKNLSRSLKSETTEKESIELYIQSMDIKDARKKKKL